MIKAIPLTLKQANAFIDEYHRHHVHAQGDKYRIGAEVDGELVGVIQCGRPVSRHLDDGMTIECIRLCTKGNKNVASFLLSRASRVAQSLGYTKIITYILTSELGTSLIASGWELEEKSAGGGSWNVPSRPRELEESQISMFETRQKYPTEKKQRWAKKLKQ